MDKYVEVLQQHTKPHKDRGNDVRVLEGDGKFKVMYGDTTLALLIFEDDTIVYLKELQFNN